MDPKLRKILAKSCAFINPQPPQRHHTAQGPGNRTLLVGSFRPHGASWEAPAPRPRAQGVGPSLEVVVVAPQPREPDPPGKFLHHGPRNRTLLGGSGHTAQGNPTLLGSFGHTAPKTGSSWEVRPHHPRSGTLQRTIVASLIMGICYFNLFLVFLEEK